MVDPGEIQSRLLQRLAGGLSPADLSAWARGVIAFDTGEGPSLFDADEEMLRHVLKRCAIETEPGFEMSGEDIRTLLRRVAYSDSARSARGRREGPFLVAFRARMAPASAFPIVGNCGRCGSPVRLADKTLPKILRAGGALACLWCARALPGAVVGKL
ncbi:MAG TPA: hypothetical protein VKH46_10675 [Thermoanaerobaculia bacterium]|nr:hypothetical protein [Thermoanaerobaculia bacterium]